MIDVKEEDDGSFTISWDENDPKESILNDFTEQDFIDVIVNHIKNFENNAIDGKGQDLS